MESQQTTTSPGGDAPQPEDRLTKALVWVALVLVAIVGFLAVDLWQDRTDGPETTQSSQATPVAIQPTSLPLPTAAPSPVPVTPPPCVAPHDWVIHTVEQGNTLYSLGQQYGTDVDTLKLVNCLEGDTILIGQALHVPGPPGAAAMGATDSTTVTTVAEATPVATTTSHTASEPLPTVDVQSGFPDNFLNIVLLGSDKREESSTWRTDTIIILSVDTESDFIRLLSIPRDLWVNIPGHGDDRINTADLWGELAGEGGGPDLVKQTIAQNLGMPIHYYIRVDFDGFVKIIDAIGGLEIDVECPLPDIELEPGMQQMDGELALLYARSRISSSDFDRSRRQRKLLMALWEQGLSVGIIPRLPALSSATADTLQTDIPFDQVVALAYKGLQLRPSNIFSNSIGPWQVENWTTPQGAAVLLPIDEEVQKLLSIFYAPPDMEFLELISQTRVQVLNGSQRQDADKLAATTLRWAGFQATPSGLADSQAYAESQVIVYSGSELVAETAAQLLDLPRTSLQYQHDPSSRADIVIILGADYDPCR
jgi:LCP family protein required for cell wall assembly